MLPTFVIASMIEHTGQVLWPIMFRLENYNNQSTFQKHEKVRMIEAITNTKGVCDSILSKLTSQ